MEADVECRDVPSFSSIGRLRVLRTERLSFNPFKVASPERREISSAFGSRSTQKLEIKKRKKKEEKE